MRKPNAMIKRTIQIVFIAAATGFAWYATPIQRGKALAHLHHLSGRYEIKVVGSEADLTGPGYTHAGTNGYVRVLAGGPDMPHRKRIFVEAYNAVSIPAIETKFGKGAFTWVPSRLIDGEIRSSTLR